MEIAGLIIASIALIFSIFTFFLHDRKIKKQAIRLNEYQLFKIEKESIELKSAIIEAFVISGKGGNSTIKIYNKGKCTAKDVMVTIPDNEGFIVFNNPSPMDIRPQNSIEITLGLHMGSPDKTRIEFEWKDDNKPNNKESQIIQL